MRRAWLGAVNVLTCSAYSEGFQEGQQRVWWPVAAGRGCWRRDSGEGFLLEGRVRVQLPGGLAQHEHVHRLARHFHQIVGLPMTPGPEPVGDVAVVTDGRDRPTRARPSDNQ